MSGTTLDDVVVPYFTDGLKTLDHILTKAEEYAMEKGINANAVFPDARLIEDQLPLTTQVQYATRMIKRTLHRVTGIQYQPFTNEGNEKTMEDMHALIQEALDLLKTVQSGVFKAEEEKLVEVKDSLGKVVYISAKEAILTTAIPNFFFHLITAYSILRAKGVHIGKTDYMSNFAPS